MKYIVEKRTHCGRWRTVATLGVVATAAYATAALAALTATAPGTIARVRDERRVVRTFTHLDRDRLLEPVRRAVARSAGQRAPAAPTRRERIRMAVKDYSRRKGGGGDGQQFFGGDA